MPTYVDNKKIKKVYLGETTKIKKIYYGTDLVFTSGTSVSYFYGDTLIGIEDVDDGESVLFPSNAITSKLDSMLESGNALFGWSQTKGGSSAKNVYASEDIDSMSLYAVVLPTSVVIYDSISSVTLGSGGWPDIFKYEKKEANPEYLSIAFNKVDAIGNKAITYKSEIENMVKGNIANNQMLVGHDENAQWPSGDFTNVAYTDVSVSLGEYKRAEVVFGFWTCISRRSNKQDPVGRFTVTSGEFAPIEHSINNDIMVSDYAKIYHNPDDWNNDAAGNSALMFEIPDVKVSFYSDFSGQMITKNNFDRWHVNDYNTGWGRTYTMIKSITLYKE